MGIWLDAPEDFLLKRVASRIGDASDADADVVAHQLTYDIGPIAWTRIDASRSVESLRREILERSVQANGDWRRAPRALQ
jgi:hypothetical protein